MVNQGRRIDSFLRRILQILVLLSLINIVYFPNINAQIIRGKDWKKIYQLVKENKLPMLSEEEEEEILEKVDKILKEDKSIYLATLYLAKRVGNYEGGYVVYGNSRIKEKLIELMKIKIQCGLKRSINKTREYIVKKLEDYDSKERKEKESSLINETKLRVLELRLEELIKKDGDKCEEYCIDDKEEDIQKRNIDDEGLPGGYSWDVAVFYSIALSTFPTDVYEYLWVDIDRYSFKFLDPNILYLSECEIIDINFATTYAEQLIEDLKRGKIEGDRVCLNEWKYMPFYKICGIIKRMLDMNKELLRKEREFIKEILFQLTENRLKDYSEKRKEILENREETYEWNILRDLYTNDVWTRIEVLEIYEQIGEREDIEDIKRLGEGIDMDYPVRETNRAGDEKMKARYLQEVKELQDRVNTLVEKLSRE